MAREGVAQLQLNALGKEGGGTKQDVGNHLIEPAGLGLA